MATALLLFCLLFSTDMLAGELSDHWRDSLLQQISGAVISPNEVSIERFGARGDGTKDCRPAFVKAMKYARRHGGAHIVVPRGTWLVKGPIHLVSNVCLDLQEGAVLSFDATPAYYLPVVETSWEGTPLWNYSPFIYGRNLHDVAIIGSGTIDGNSGDTFATWRPRQKEGQNLSRSMNHEGRDVSERLFGEGYFLRPQLIQLYGCTGVTLEDFFMRESPFWCVHLLQSKNIICRRLRYDAKLVNNDGIDIESSRSVLIEDVMFNNGDDNIAIKSGRDNDGWAAAMPSEDIIVSNCHFLGLHGVVLGSEMSGGIRRVLVENCDSRGYCKRGIFAKTNPDRGGYIRDIAVRNCTFGTVLDLFYVTSMYAGQGLDNDKFSDIDGITVDSLSAVAVEGTAIVLQGTAAKPIRNVSLSNIFVGKAANGLSFENTEPVQMQNCFIGPKVGVPSLVSDKDKIFDR